MSRPWDHLPNAKHIDSIIESTVNNSSVWASIQVEKITDDMQRQWKIMYDESRGGAWDNADELLRDKLRELNVRFTDEANFRSSFDAIAALFGYDDCAYMLESDPDELRILAKFGDLRAVLLLPACKALHIINSNSC